MTWFASLLLFGKGVMDWLLGRRRAEEREDAETVGAMKQRHADDQAALEAKDEQLEEAVRRRPGDALRKLLRGDF